MLWYEYPGVADRFDSKIDRSATCHLWTASTAGAGYGVFRLARPVRTQAYAHRLALERKLGRALQVGERALHSCDTPACVNPDHLRTGDQFDNMGDAVRRGRIRHGEGITQARLTETEVREIYALTTVPGLTDKEISTRYGISRTQVTNIKNGKSWCRVTASTVVR